MVDNNGADEKEAGNPAVVDIVIQLSAIKSAVNRAGITVLTCHLVQRLKNSPLETGDVNVSLADFMSVLKKLS